MFKSAPQASGPLSELKILPGKGKCVGGFEDCPLQELPLEVHLLLRIFCGLWVCLTEVHPGMLPEVQVM